MIYDGNEKARIWYEREILKTELDGMMVVVNIWEHIGFYYIKI